MYIETKITIMAVSICAFEHISNYVHLFIGQVNSTSVMDWWILNNQESKMCVPLS